MFVRSGVAIAAISCAYAIKRVFSDDFLNFQVITNIPRDTTSANQSPRFVHVTKDAAPLSLLVPENNTNIVPSRDQSESSFTASLLSELDTRLLTDTASKLLKHIKINEKNLNDNCKAVVDLSEKNLQILSLHQRPLNPMKPSLLFQDSFYPVGESFDESDSNHFEYLTAETCLIQLLRVLHRVYFKCSRGETFNLNSSIFRDLHQVLNLSYSSLFMKSMAEVLVGKIVCSISLNETFSKQLYRSEIYKTICSWEFSSFSFKRLIACKLQHNISQSKHKTPDGVYEVCKVANPDVDVVMLHGLNGSAFHTWRPGGPSVDTFGQCWPTSWLMEDIPGTRVVLLDFEASGGSKVGQQLSNDEEVTIKSRAHEFLLKLKQIGIGERPIVFIGHSMGGLIIKQLLLQAKDIFPELLHQTEGIVFLSTPHFGSPIVPKIARFSKFFEPSVTLLQMDIHHSGLLSLNFDFIKLMLTSDAKCLSIAESLPTSFGFGLHFTVVPLLSAYPGCGRFLVLKVVYNNPCFHESLFLDQRLFQLNMNEYAIFCLFSYTRVNPGFCSRHSLVMIQKI